MKDQDPLSTAMDCFATGDLAGAIEAAKMALEENAASADAYEMLGEFCKQAGRLDEAITCAKKLVEIDPSSIMGHVNLSRYYMLKGDKETAELWQEKAHQLSAKTS